MTTAQVIDHLRRVLPGFVPRGVPEPLPGGLLNRVWRVPGTVAGVIVKHAPPYLATAPEVPLDPGRLLFEARALAVLGPGGPLEAVATPEVRPPHLLHLDEDAFVLVMEDMGDPPDLGAWLRSGRPVEGLGTSLGRFIGTLHRVSCGDASLARTFHNLPIQQTRHAVQYRAVEALCGRAGLADAQALGALAVALGERLQQPGCCLVQGDLWPPSVLVAEPASPGTAPVLRLIDWEFAHYGRPAQDVAHLAAHLWMHAHRAATGAVRAAAQALLRRFLEAYVAAVGDRADHLLTPDERAACAVHFGAEILVRTVGAFQDGYLYDGLPPEAPAVQEAVAVAATHLRDPAAADTFAALKREA